MPDHRARHRPRLRNNEELRDVDQRCEQPAEEDQYPARGGDRGERRGEDVYEGDHVEESDGCHGGLVEEELHGGHVESAVVGGDPDRVEGGGKDAEEGEQDTKRGGGCDCGGASGGCGRWKRIIVGDGSDTEACGDERKEGVAREGGAVEDEVHGGDSWGQQNTGELVEGDTAEGEG